MLSPLTAGLQALVHQPWKQMGGLLLPEVVLLAHFPLGFQYRNFWDQQLAGLERVQRWIASCWLEDSQHCIHSCSFVVNGGVLKIDEEPKDGEAAEKKRDKDLCLTNNPN